LCTSSSPIASLNIAEIEIAPRHWMGAKRMSNLTATKRGLTSVEAMRYLGVRRRTWTALRGQLRPMRIGTSLIYDRRDLDAFFDRLKSSQQPTRGNAGADVPPDVEQPTVDVVRSALDGRPSARMKGGNSWAVYRASTRTPRPVNGALTNSSEDSAFKVVTARIRKRSPGC
jgi:Helix-turn-helix domain